MSQIPENEPSASQPEVSEGLTKCAVVVEKAIDHLLGEDHPPLAVASALLGGSLGLLARSMDSKTILRVLEQAAQSVRTGELQAAHDAQKAGNS